LTPFLQVSCIIVLLSPTGSFIVPRPSEAVVLRPSVYLA
jgi:hypothetical protein